VRGFSLHLLGWMISVETDGRPTKFTLPQSLTEAWQMAPADSEESFWDKLHRRLSFNTKDTTGTKAIF
jgi:hypothetical protein